VSAVTPIPADRLAAREAMLRRVCCPLPGTVPQENRRPVNIRAAHDRWGLLDALSDRFPQIPRAEWEQRCDAGRFVSLTGAIRGKRHVVRAGEQLQQIFPQESEPPVATDIRLLYEDEVMVVVCKPAPLPMHPSGRFRRNTLQHLLNLAYAPETLLPVHRLDANTTGVALLARTRLACRLLQRQFLDGTVDKRYLVRVTGHPLEDAFISTASVSTMPHALGTRAIDETAGRPARTDFRVIERRADGTALLEAVLGTGRTHQIRLHLWHLGHPVVGDPAYLADRLLGDTQTLAMDARPLELTAWRLTLRHPLTGEPLDFESGRPAWA
jgi:RluA family pseudouridine synthase